MSEFCLSDKLVERNKVSKKSLVCSEHVLREFIVKLKEKACNCFSKEQICKCNVCHWTNKLAGPKLIVPQENSTLVKAEPEGFNIPWEKQYYDRLEKEMKGTSKDVCECGHDREYHGAELTSCWNDLCGCGKFKPRHIYYKDGGCSCGLTCSLKYEKPKAEDENGTNN